MAFSTKQSQIVLRIQILRRFGGNIDTGVTREATIRRGSLTRHAGARFNQDLNLLYTAGYSAGIMDGLALVKVRATTIRS